ncbi:MAG TPA: type 1 glutamine amidotransferase domain-containing protein [Desulfuromonadaceae bacterium]|jgi:protease I
MKALILSADNFEDLELLVPLYRLQEAGYQVEVASHSLVPIRGKHGYEVKVDKTFEEVDPADYAVLLLPGGKAPEAIRNNVKAQAIARTFFERKKPVAAICHGPQTLISADLISGRRATCYKTVAPEMKEANVKYEDSEVVVDGNLITSRQPEDLPAFMRELMRMLAAHSSWQ